MDVQAYVAAEVRERSESMGMDALSRAVSAINTSISSHSRHLSVSFHEATGRRMVTVYDSETNEAIREIPPQRVLDAHASILELAGLFVDRRG
jgi:flagellar protein FlaG